MNTAKAKAATSAFLTKVRVSDYTDKQLRDEIRALRDVLLERQRIRATKRQFAKIPTSTV